MQVKSKTKPEVSDISAKYLLIFSPMLSKLLEFSCSDGDSGLVFSTTFAHKH